LKLRRELIFWMRILHSTGKFLKVLFHHPPFSHLMDGLALSENNTLISNLEGLVKEFKIRFEE